MPRSSYTEHFKRRTGASAGEEALYLLEISHPQLAEPIRVVRDTVDLERDGHTYVAMNFDVRLPEDVQRQLPRAPVQIDNVGRELTQWLDASNGGRGAQVRVMQVMRDTPEVIEYDITMDLLNVKQNRSVVIGELGYEDTLSQSGLPAQYRPDNTPGIF